MYCTRRGKYFLRCRARDKFYHRHHCATFKFYNFCWTGEQYHLSLRPCFPSSLSYFVFPTHSPPVTFIFSFFSLCLLQSLRVLAYHPFFVSFPISYLPFLSFIFLVSCFTFPFLSLLFYNFIFSIYGCFPFYGLFFFIYIPVLPHYRFLPTHPRSRIQG